jgi:hypothetical protein
MGTKIQRVKFDLPEGIAKRDRQAFGEALAEKIRLNAESGKGVPFEDKGTHEGIVSSYRAFKEYSKGYIKSLDFRNAGKSAGSVDLTLSGDLLQSLDVVKISSTQIELGFPSSQDGKADGNIRGTHGKSRANANKARNFLGLTENDYNKIVRKFV